MTRHATAYLRPFEQAYWAVHGEDQVIAWRSGTTVLFAEQIEELLPALVQQSFRVPPFHALFLLLASARVRGERFEQRDYDSITKVMDHVCRQETTTAKAKLNDLCNSCNSALEVLKEIPARFWTHKHAYSILATAVFSRVGAPIEKVEADAILEEVLRGIPWGSLSTEGESLSLAVLRKGLEELHEGLTRLDTKALLTLHQTGLSRLPEPIDGVDVEEHCKVSMNGFLNELEQDEEHGALARLSRHCLAGLNIPGLHRPQGLPEHTGADSLSNQGPLDRLLLSELAQDDDVLAVRLALNEALYLDREHRAQSRHWDRSVLIDTGIRMWGTPRVISTAMAMALALQVDHESLCRTFRSGSEGIVESDLTRREGLIEHLAHMNASPSPGQSLAEFLEQAPQDTDLFLIIHPTVLADGRLAEEFRRLDRGELFVITVDAEGHIVLHHMTGAGHVLLREWSVEPGRDLIPQDTRLSLAEWSDPEEHASNRIPLYLPHSVNRGICLDMGKDCFVMVSKDRRLMRWSSHERLGEQLLATMPPGHLSALGRVHDQIHVIITDREHHVHWLVLDQEPGTVHKTDIVWNSNRLREKDLCLGRSGLCLMDGCDARAWRVGDSEPSDTRELPQGTTHHGGLLKSAQGTHWIRVDHGIIEIEQVMNPKVPSSFFRNFGLADVQAMQRFRQIHPRVGTTLKSLRAMLVLPGGKIALESRTGKTGYEIVETNGCLALDDRSLRDLDETEKKRTWTGRWPFVVANLPGVKHGPCTIRFDNGDLAVVDCRGILHLRAHDNRIPGLHVSLLQPGSASCGGIAAFTDDGRRCGSARFVEDPNCPATEILDLIQRFARGVE